MRLIQSGRARLAVATAVLAASVSLSHAFDGDDGRSGFGYNGQSQSSQTYNNQQSRQYAPSQNSYQQSYNSDSNYNNRQQSDYGRQQYSYGSQPSGFPGEQRYDAGQPGERARRADTGDDDRLRRHRRHRHRPANYDWSEGERPRRHNRVSTTLSGNGWPANGAGGGWFAYGQNAVCVRTCDGYFFPMGLVSNPTSLDAQKSLCTAQCPDAKTELYFLPQGADGITTAVTEDGHPYSKMPNALRYTKAHNGACTCHAKNPQSRLVALMKDITLRRGDAVMTVNGVLVFNGAYRWPYKLADFQVLDKAKYYLSNALALAALEKAAMRVQAKGPQDRKEKPGPAEAPATFITDNSGRTVRLVGEALSYAPLDQPSQGLRPGDDTDTDTETAQSQDKSGKKATR